MTTPKIIGKTVIEAKDMLIAAGYRIRIIKEDGKSFFGDCRADPKRIDVEVENGKITKIA